MVVHLVRLDIGLRICGPEYKFLGWGWDATLFGLSNYTLSVVDQTGRCLLFTSC